METGNLNLGLDMARNVPYSGDMVTETTSTTSSAVDTLTPELYLSLQGSLWQVVFRGGPLSSLGSLQAAIEVYSSTFKQGRDLKRPYVWDASRGDWLDNAESSALGVRRIV